MALQKPLDPKAVKAANAAIAAETGGRPLGTGPGDAALRRKWTQAYLAAGGKEAKPAPKKEQAQKAATQAQQNLPAKPPTPSKACLPSKPVEGKTDKTCTSSKGQYKVGAPSRPPIRHDNGFLQNRSDPNDTKPLPTRKPTVGDYAALAAWRAKLAAGELAQGVPGVPHNDIPDALAAYRHFLDGNGADRNFSYERYVKNDKSGAVALQNATRDIQKCAANLYAEMLANDPGLAGKPVTFQITGTQIPVGADTQYPYPATENWQKAIGAHVIWMSGTVTVTPGAGAGGKALIEMKQTLHAEDRYNFNPGAQDIATGTPDADNGRLEESGLGHQYMNYSTLERTVTWTEGDPNAATVVPVNKGR